MDLLLMSFSKVKVQHAQPAWPNDDDQLSFSCIFTDSVERGKLHVCIEILKSNVKLPTRMRYFMFTS